MECCADYLPVVIAWMTTQGCNVSCWLWSRLYGVVVVLGWRVYPHIYSRVPQPSPNAECSTHDNSECLQGAFLGA